MPKWLQAVIGILLVVGIACLVVYCVAVAKDMSFVDFIKSWFEKSEEVKEPVEEVASFLANSVIKRG